MNNILRMAGAFALSMVSSVAMAAPLPPVAVPEPSSIAFFAAGSIGVFGAYAIRKWTKRK
jgi:hypothetical protein